MTRITAQSVWRDVERLRRANPLVVNVTNNVVTNTTANALLALGASPAMSHNAADVAELAALAQAVVVNPGTPAAPYIEAMHTAGRAANQVGAPVVLDPVAVFATATRRRIIESLLEDVRVAVIRGNASEIMTLAGEQAAGKGADSSHGADQAEEAARALARSLGCVVCVSGEVDLITDGERRVTVANGDAMMPKVTGLGCTASALVGAFVGVNEDRFEGCAHAMAVMGVAGELAAAKAAGPGTLQVYFYDALYNLAQADLESLLRAGG
jgi:hydroxyethylthiazole kinase